ncbi:MAG TPA: lipocalin-like domain-containing protein [Bradyrhizobium sp.]|nr:lipocalin-like domain-containing protein [Bradyrhizobium sp.]
MSGNGLLSRRAFAGGAVLLAFEKAARAQGFAGLGVSGQGFAPVVPGKKFVFPADHGAHPHFRIEWWYVTTNLTDAAGNAYGAQWTLFRQAMRSGAQQEGWANQQIWMGHAAVTRDDTHRYSETFARGDVGQAGVTPTPFGAFIDAWHMRGAEAIDNDALSPLDVTAAGPDFSYALRLHADHPLVLQGEGGYSIKSEQGQASYYYSQPYFKAAGHITIDDTPVAVTGQAWMDREWSSQPLASDQTGWDWLSLHVDTGEKLMLFRLRKADGRPFISGKWFSPKNEDRLLTSTEISMTPKAWSEVAMRKIPTGWDIAVPPLGLTISCNPLNATSWMGTRFPYWEGPIRFSGSHKGVGYLEMTGY